MAWALLRHLDRSRIEPHVVMFQPGPFEREITLPANLRFDRDGIRANYRDGFLVISLPTLSEPPPTRRVIEINAE